MSTLRKALLLAMLWICVCFVFYLICIFFAPKRELTPEREYNIMWNHVQREFFYRERLGKWKQYEHPAQIFHDHAEAERYLNEILKTLGDKYTRMVSPATLPPAPGGKAEAPVKVNYRLLDGGIGYVLIPEFFGGSGMELQEALKSLKEARAYILDLRNNPGGMVDEALVMFSLLAGEGRFTTIEGYAEESLHTQQIDLTQSGIRMIRDGVELDLARATDLVGGKPMIVLINHNSASSAEMLAAALEDDHFATLVGTTSYGKGIIQEEYAINDNAYFYVTFGRWLRPNRTCIHGTGVAPDTVLERKGKDDNQLREAIRQLKLKLCKN